MNDTLNSDPMLQDYIEEIEILTERNTSLIKETIVLRKEISSLHETISRMNNLLTKCYHKAHATRLQCEETINDLDKHFEI